jgi:hypothetical protein
MGDASLAMLSLFVFYVCEEVELCLHGKASSRVPLEELFKAGFWLG